MIPPAAATIRIVAAVIVDAHRHVLLVRKRGTSSFMQPGGKIEPGEAPLDALIREIREELGCGVDTTTARPLGRFTADAANEPGHVVDADLFLVTLDADPLPAAEIEELAWVEPGAVDGRDIAPLTMHPVFTLVRDGLS